MSHKKFLLPITLGAFALGVSAASSPVMASASASEWIVGGGSPIVTDVENGVSMTGTSGWGSRLGHKEKISVDGLSFDWKVNGFTAAECRGFYFFSADTAASEANFPYFDGQSSTVFTMWAVSEQARLYCLPNHDYNAFSNALNVNGTGSDAATGFSTADANYALICNMTSSFTLNFKFSEEKENFYKIQITSTGLGIWGDKNYNRDSSVDGSVTTYISKKNMNVNSDGFVRIGTVGMDKKGTDDTVQFLNLNYRSGVEFSNLPTTYTAGEELDVSGITAVESWKLGSKVNIGASDLTVTGYDKAKTGDQEVTVSYKGFSKTFTVRNKAAVDAADAFGTTFLNKTSSACADPDANNKEALEAVWADVKDAYNALSDDAKTIVKTTAAKNDGSDLEKAVALYDHIVARYGEEFNFMGRNVQSSPSNYLTNENTTLFISLIVIATLTSVALIGATLIIRKRKEN